MAGKREIITILRSFAVHNKTHELPLDELLAFTVKYVEKRSTKVPALRDLANNTAAKLKALLGELAEEGRCTIEAVEGKPGIVHYPEFYLDLVRKRYEELKENSELPFVSEQAMGLVIPSDHITPVDVKKDFVNLLEEPQLDEPRLLRLVFPEGITSVVIPSDLLESDLMRLSLQRIRHYLGIQKNAFYMISKLRSVFRTKEQVVKDTINAILTQRQQAVESLIQPSEFSFSFWTHLANAILKEFRDKTNKLEREYTFCHASYLLGFYAVHYKGVRRKEKDAALAFKTLDRKLHSDPYVYTVTEIAQFTDDQGTPLTSKYSRNELHAYIEKKTRPTGDEPIPDIVRLRTSDKNEYYICREIILPLSVKKTHEASREMLKHYTEMFVNAIENVKRIPEMRTDQAFLTDVEKRVKSEYPLLSALLSYEMLFLLIQELKPSPEVSAEINRLLDTQHRKIIQLDEALRLSRKDLVNQARMRLPFWKTVPFLNKFFGFLGKFATGQSVSKQGRQKSARSRPSYGPAPSVESSAPVSSTKVLGSDMVGGSRGSAPAAKRGKTGGPEVLQRAMSKLKVEFIGDANINDSMQSLAERWNPLVDPGAKANLIEDVNSLIRDFLRKLKRSFLVSPPNASRIRTMAESLSANHALDKIKRKDELARYMELYMIKVLGGK